MSHVANKVKNLLTLLDKEVNNKEDTYIANTEGPSYLDTHSSSSRHIREQDSSLDTAPSNVYNFNHNSRMSRHF